MHRSTQPGTPGQPHPVLPTVGNHDAGYSESSDDRDQLADNMFLDERFRPEVETGAASLSPGFFYRFEVGANLEFICIDTSIAGGIEHYFDDPAHARWVRDALRGGGASGKLRTEPPRDFEQAGTRAWAAAGHFLLGHADERRVVLRALDGSLAPIGAVDPGGRPFEPSVEIR
jgi:hypothetical protein